MRFLQNPTEKINRIFNSKQINFIYCMKKREFNALFYARGTSLCEKVYKIAIKTVGFLTSV